MNKPHEIYSDMDGVLADFHGQCVKLLGKPYSDSAYEHKEAQNVRNQKIANTKHFWEEIPLERGFDQYWNFIKHFDPHILTAYAKWDEENSKRGKVIWNHKYLKVPANRFHVVARENKKRYALTDGKPNVLIDDYDKNITEWEAAGGIGIFFTSASQAIFELKELGFKV